MYVRPDAGLPELKITGPLPEAPRSATHIFASTGAHVAALEDVYRFAPIFRTTKPNRDTLITFGFKSSVWDTTRAVEPLGGGGSSDFATPAFTGAAATANTGGSGNLATSQQNGSRIEENTHWQMIQFLRFLVDEDQEDGALAEVEVIAFGQNIAQGTAARGGVIDDQGKERAPAKTHPSRRRSRGAGAAPTRSATGRRFWPRQ